MAEDKPDPKEKLTPQQMRDWNAYVSWLEKKGYAGSKDLDKKETGLARNLLTQFIKENPTTSITYEDVKKVQLEMQKVRDSVQAFSARRGDANASKLMGGISSVDGWPGSRTTSYKFPDLQETSYHNNQLVSDVNMGLMGGDFKPTGLTGAGQQPAKPKKQLPKGVKLEAVVDAQGNKSIVYEDPNTGDLVRWDN